MHGEGRLELKNIIFESGITNFPLNIIENYILLASKEHKAISEARRNFSSILEEASYLGGEISRALFSMLVWSSVTLL